MICQETMITCFQGYPAAQHGWKSHPDNFSCLARANGKIGKSCATWGTDEPRAEDLSPGMTLTCCAEEERFSDLGIFGF